MDARTPQWSIQNYLRTDVYYYRPQFGKALKHAAQDGDLELVKWLFTHFSGCIAPADVVEIAATNGHFHILEYLLNHDVGQFGPHLKYQDDENAEDEWAIFQWIPRRPREGNAVTWGTDAILEAIQRGHFKLARWLVFSTPRTFDDEEVTEQHGAGGGVGTRGSMSARVCAKTPSVQTIEWMLTCDYLRPDEDIHPWLILFLARKDRLDLMQPIWEIFAASQKNLNLEPWLGHWRTAMEEAAACGNMTMLRWLAEHSVGREVCANKGSRRRMLSLKQQRGAIY